jgi:sugar fermentation stimulation protein A
MIKPRIPKKPGTYTLIIKVIQPFRMKIGKLGCHNFPMGTYTYTGSAIGTKASNLNLRLGRHLKPKKRKHWHIDYFLSSESVSIWGIVFLETDSKLECKIAQKLFRINGCSSLVNGFGSSDCQMGCKSHLYHFNNTQEEVIPKIIEQYETFGIPNILQVENVESVRTTITEKLYSKI